MKYESRSKTHIDEQGHKITRIYCEFIPEPGDQEKEIEYIRDCATFLSSHGHKGNIWERKLRAIKEND